MTAKLKNADSFNILFVPPHNILYWSRSNSYAAEACRVRMPSIQLHSYKMVKYMQRELPL